MYRAAYDTIDRRNDIFHFIRRKRETHLKEIMDEFGISRATAIRDIRYISDHIALIDSRPGVYGYIRFLNPESTSSFLRLSTSSSISLLLLRDCLEKKEVGNDSGDMDEYLKALDEAINLCVSPFSQREYEKHIKHKR